jgi:hypothetical protein
MAPFSSTVLKIFFGRTSQNELVEVFTCLRTNGWLKSISPKYSRNGMEAHGKATTKSVGEKAYVERKRKGGTKRTPSRQQPCETLYRQFWFVGFV